MFNTKFVTIIIAFVFFGGISAGKHPLHVSTTEVNFNARDKTLEVSCRIFSDDFEAVLSKTYKQKTDLSNLAMKAAMDELVKRYLITHLQVMANGQPTKMNYLGFEIDHEATNIYLEVEKIPSLKSLKVTNTILYDMFDDQMSIVHLVKGNVRKSAKILYPDKQFGANF
ncbi:DUF6702 family protein [Pedobacter endophyticus]|uniref:Peptidase E n=1 Tax=Pedobacter endophyticus TaxID=2789740 RepID=A0A7U3Q3X7_9SPHI|nr:DUF6702 family protein [Pedobacter endophyticus]QPH38155.1 hypothetical protein IZT61_13740 [Pedobacter endophyticus]